MKMNKKCLCGLVIAALAFSMVFAGCKKTTGDDNSALIAMIAAQQAIPSGIYGGTFGNFNGKVGDDGAYGKLSITSDGTELDFTADTTFNYYTAKDTKMTGIKFVYADNDNDGMNYYWYFIENTAGTEKYGFLACRKDSSGNVKEDSVEIRLGKDYVNDTDYIAFGNNKITKSDITDGKITGFGNKF
jgi:hypothetical protein